MSKLDTAIYRLHIALVEDYDAGVETDVYEEGRTIVNEVFHNDPALLEAFLEKNELLYRRPDNMEDYLDGTYDSLNASTVMYDVLTDYVIEQAQIRLEEGIKNP